MSENDNKDITELLQTLMEAGRISEDKLSEMTDVPKRFIASLTRGEFDQLPAKPYVRGYLFKIAEVLKTNPHRMWEAYRKSAEVAASGPGDRLPTNRFATTRVKPSWLAGGFLLILLIVFLGFRLDDILGNPPLTVSVPETTNEEFITVRGSVTPGDRLTLNKEVIFPKESGEFEKEVQLEPGLNTLTFRVERYLGREATYIYQVFYEPRESTELPGPQPATPTEPAL